MFLPSGVVSFRNERGSALMLVPAGILVLIALSAIAVDSAIAFMAQREMLNRAAGAANDAVTAGISPDQLQRGYDARPEPALVNQIVRSRLVGHTVAGYRIEANDVRTTVIDDTVTVFVEGDIDYIFSGAIPGARDQAHVTATSSAQVRFRG